MEDRWTSRSLPLLAQIANDEPAALEVRSVSEQLGMTPAQVVAEIERLVNAGYIAVGRWDTSMLGDIDTTASDVRLEERGARAVGMWPSEEPYDVLLEAIERRIAEEPDEEKKGRLRTASRALGDVGKGTLSAVLAELLKAGIR